MVYPPKKKKKKKKDDKILEWLRDQRRKRAEEIEKAQKEGKDSVYIPITKETCDAVIEPSLRWKSGSLGEWTQALGRAMKEEKKDDNN